jgi:magnesium chelatase family protein
MLATVCSAALLGIDAVPVQVEVNTGESGVPNLILVGLPDAAVKESEDRVFSALSNSALRMPRTRTTINLAPGDLRKEGAIYDLPIALGILVATGQLVCEKLDDFLIAGELILSGVTRPIKGGLAMAVLARESGKKAILLPPLAAQEAALVEGITVYEITSLDQANRFLGEQIPLTPLLPPRAPAATVAVADSEPDFAEIKGQHALRRAVEVAVAGNHNLLLLS